MHKYLLVSIKWIIMYERSMYYESSMHMITYY